MIYDDDDDDDDDDEGNEMEKSVELSEALSTERILLQLQLMDKHKLKRAKKVLEVIKKSERVKINKDNEEFTLIKCQQVLKHQFFCMIYNNKLKNFTTLLLY